MNQIHQNKAYPKTIVANPKMYPASSVVVFVLFPVVLLFVGGAVDPLHY
jgi:hypothetical protein